MQTHGPWFDKPSHAGGSFFFFAYAYVCRCVCIWKPKVDIRQLPQSLPTSVFEAEYLTELGAHQLASRTASLADHLFSRFRDSRITGPRCRS